MIAPPPHLRDHLFGQVAWRAWRGCPLADARKWLGRRLCARGPFANDAAGIDPFERRAGRLPGADRGSIGLDDGGIAAEPRAVSR